MCKIFVILCVALVVSVVSAHDPVAEEQKKMELALKECVESINRIRNMIAEHYEKTVKPITYNGLRDRAFHYYNVVTDKLNKLKALVLETRTDGRFLFANTFGGAGMPCNDDIARSVYRAYYEAYDGLNRITQLANE